MNEFGINAPPPREPSADIRQAAAALRGMYIALIAEGFSAPEALVIIGYCLAGKGGGG